MRFPGRQFMFQLVVYSLMFHSTVGQIASFIIMSSLKMVDTYWAMIIPSWGSTLGLYLMKNFMDTTVSDAVLESARLDGAKEFLIFLKIYVSLSMDRLSN